MPVRLAVAIRVPQAPDAVAIEDKHFVVADGERQRFVQSGSEPLPAHDTVRRRQPANKPDVTIEGHPDASAVGQELEITQPDVSPPRIIEGQRNVVDDVRIARLRPYNAGD